MPTPTPPLVTIDTVHDHVHKGITVQASYKSPEGADVADNSDVTLAIFTGRRTSHLAFQVAAGGDAELLLYEGASLSANGTNLSAYNLNRADSIFTPSTHVTHTPSVTTNGILLHNSFLPGGIAGGSVGGTARSETEWELKADTIYMIKLINRGGNAQPMSIVAQWYEEEPG